MLNGLYQCTKNWQGNNEYDIKVRVKETEKSYSMQLVENNSRYSPGHIDMLFSKKDKIMIKKEKSQHSMNVWSDNDFTIYPFRAGIPFHFEKITTAEEKITLRKKWDRERCGMNRTRDVAKAIEEIRNMTDVTEASLEQMKVGLLGHIAVSLAVIADKLTEEEEGSEK